jgi:hypothetical protein
VKEGDAEERRMAVYGEKGGGGGGGVGGLDGVAVFLLFFAFLIPKGRRHGTWFLFFYIY